MARPSHPDKDIEDAVQFAEDHGWRYVHSRGHAWARLFCPRGARGGCIISVWSTPRHPFTHAQYIRREVGKCPH